VPFQVHPNLGGEKATGFTSLLLLLAGDPGCTSSNWNGCDPNGGCNASDVASFAPSNLNVAGWVESFQALGATSAVLTAKHGCGFLGWQTNVTLPDGSPYRYHVPAHLNVIEQFVAATTAANIGHGFYYSLTNNFYLNAQSHNVRPPSTLLPGQASVTQAQYEDIAIAQMTELWTQFGDLTEIWLDGACCESRRRCLSPPHALPPTHSQAAAVHSAIASRRS
jgi:alpha-L-fucosidase